jgi:hypothetical protein
MLQGPDDAGAEVGLHRQPEPVEPLGVRGVLAEPGREPVRTGPAIGAADPGGVVDRDRAGVDLLAVIFGQAGRQQDPYLVERAPQPAGAAVVLALTRQHRQQVDAVAGHLGQEPGLAAPASRCRTIAMASGPGALMASCGYRDRLRIVTTTAVATSVPCSCQSNLACPAPAGTGMRIAKVPDPRAGIRRMAAQLR